jgi:hypothetical protein
MRTMSRDPGSQKSERTADDMTPQYFLQTRRPTTNLVASLACFHSSDCDLTRLMIASSTSVMCGGVVTGYWALQTSV